MSEYLKPVIMRDPKDNQTQTHGKQCNCLTAGEVTPVEVTTEPVEGYEYTDAPFDFDYFIADPQTQSD